MEDKEVIDNIINSALQNLMGYITTREIKGTKKR